MPPEAGRFAVATEMNDRFLPNLVRESPLMVECGPQGQISHHAVGERAE